MGPISAFLFLDAPDDGETTTPLRGRRQSLRYSGQLLLLRSSIQVFSMSMLMLRSSVLLTSNLFSYFFLFFIFFFPAGHHSVFCY